jgi:type III restriction enzyme
MHSNLTEHDLMTWLDKQVRQKGLTQTQLRAYLIKLIAYLMHERRFSLTALLRTKFQLAQAVREEINRLMVLARTEAFQGDLFGQMTVAPVPEPWNQFEFKAGVYPLHDAYRGSYTFNKHFYAQIDDLREKTKDGKHSEEFVCARLIDMHPKVKYWVRNIPQQRQTSFWLPIASGCFYPDFVCELESGAIAVIEYKGGHLVTNDESREKELVGLQWAKGGEGKRIFVMVRPQNEDAKNRTVEQQINDALI